MASYETMIGEVLLGGADPVHTARRVGLKYAASRQVFCPMPECGDILDERRTVLLALGDSMSAVCSECATTERIRAVVEAGGRVEAWDWARGEGVTDD